MPLFKPLLYMYIRVDASFRKYLYLDTSVLLWQWFLPKVLWKFLLYNLLCTARLSLRASKNNGQNCELVSQSSSCLLLPHFTTAVAFKAQSYKNAISKCTTCKASYCLILSQIQQLFITYYSAYFNTVQLWWWCTQYSSSVHNRYPALYVISCVRRKMAK